MAAIVLVTCAIATTARGESASPEPQRGGTPIEPPPQVDPVYIPAVRTPGLPERTSVTADARTSLELRLGLDIPLRQGDTVGSQTQGTPAATPALHAAVRWVPFKDSYWFARVVFYRYLHASEQQPWNPDYAYSFGYEDWHPGAWSATYSNYTGTRWNPDALPRQGRLNFPQGLLATTYRFTLSESMRSVFLAGDGDEAICTAGAELTPRYMDLASLTERGNRVAATLGCRYTRADGWFAGVVAFVYPRRFQQQPWDPDFTYSFGLLNVRPGTWSVWYSNYSGNRFPGRSRAAAEGTPRSGIVTVSWRFD